MSWEPISKSLGSIIDERLSSPLISSFTISWSIINWKFFVILFSDTSVSQTFEMANKLYNNSASDLFGWTIAAPFAASLIYIYWLPKLSQPIFRQWRISQQGNENIRNEHPLEKMLTQAEAWELEKKQLELDGALAQERLTVRTLRGDLHVANSKIEELEPVRKKLEQVILDGKTTQELLHVSEAERKEREMELNSTHGRYRSVSRQNDLMTLILEESGVDVSSIAHKLTKLPSIILGDREIEPVQTNEAKLLGDIIRPLKKSRLSSNIDASVTIGLGDFPNDAFIWILETIRNGIKDEAILLKLGGASKEKVGKVLKAFIQESFVFVEKTEAGLRYSITDTGEDYLRSMNGGGRRTKGEEDTSSVAARLIRKARELGPTGPQIPESLLLQGVREVFPSLQTIGLAQIKVIKFLTADSWVDRRAVEDLIERTKKGADWRSVMNHLIEKKLVLEHPTGEGFRLDVQGIEMRLRISQLEKSYAQLHLTDDEI